MTDNVRAEFDSAVKEFSDGVQAEDYSRAAAVLARIYGGLAQGVKDIPLPFSKLDRSGSVPERTYLPKLIGELINRNPSKVAAESFSLAYVYFRHRVFKSAFSHFKKAGALDSTNELYFLVSHWASRKREIQLAVSAANRLVKLSGGEPKYRKLVAEAHLIEGSWSEAINTLKVALADNPQATELRRMLVGTQLLAGQFKEAELTIKASGCSKGFADLSMIRSFLQGENAEATAKGMTLVQAEGMKFNFQIAGMFAVAAGERGHMLIEDKMATLLGGVSLGDLKRAREFAQQLKCNNRVALRAAFSAFPGIQVSFERRKSVSEAGEAWRPGTPVIISGINPLF